MPPPAARRDSPADTERPGVRTRVGPPLFHAILSFEFLDPREKPVGITATPPRQLVKCFPHQNHTIGLSVAEQLVGSLAEGAQEFLFCLSRLAFLVHTIDLKHDVGGGRHVCGPSLMLLPIRSGSRVLARMMPASRRAMGGALVPD